MNILIQILVLVALLGSGLIAGVLYAFSGAVMSALGRIPSAEGIRAMQSINSTIINPLFMLSFIGTAIVSTAVVVFGILGHLGESSIWFSSASLLYIIGTFIITVVGNVPMNEKLDTVNPESGDAYWRIYLSKWTRLNHFRTICALTACALFAIGFILN
ncbi:MAG: DUF1772 domain-containing protein [Puniceicoccaceae bacterium]